jgi:hypothetical protein
VETKFPLYNNRKLVFHLGRFILKKRSTAFKPTKKTTNELMKAISNAINANEYYFNDHGDKISRVKKS